MGAPKLKSLFERLIVVFLEHGDHAKSGLLGDGQERAIGVQSVANEYVE
jgi:hypothetical protein